MRPLLSGQNGVAEIRSILQFCRNAYGNPISGAAAQYKENDENGNGDAEQPEKGPANFAA